MNQIFEVYKKTLELFEIPEQFISITVEYISDDSEHEDIIVIARFGSEYLADDLDSLLFLLQESSSDSFKETAKDLELWIEEMRTQAKCPSRADAEKEEYESDLADLNAEFWATR